MNYAKAAGDLPVAFGYAVCGDEFAGWETQNTDVASDMVNGGADKAVKVSKNDNHFE